jgi:acyl CoA:acetate/3-ketoacid CoA transferase
MKEVVITLLVAVLILFIFKGNHNNEPIVITQIDTIVKHDTLRKYKKGDSIPFVIVGIDTTTIHDTVRIVQDYSYVRAYSDTFRIDTDNYVSIQDTISKNKIIGRSYFSNFTQKTIRIESIKTEPSKTEVYLGLLGDLRRFDQKVGIGVGLAIKVPKKGLFTFGVTTNQYTIGFYTKF